MTAKPQKQNGDFKKVLKRITKDRLAFLAGITLLILYLLVLFADFISPYSEHWYNRDIANMTPTPIYLVDEEDSSLSWPYVYQQKRQFNSETLAFEFMPVKSKKYYLKFFTQGDDYHFLGIIPSNLHLFGVDTPGHINLLGTDMNGRDLFSRLWFGGQISMTIGFLGLFIAFPIGLIYGGISGYFGGFLDTTMMRIAEVIMSIPSFYLLISLAAVLPPEMDSSASFGFVVAILAFIGWAGFSRVIRGMVLSIKTNEFIEAGRAIGVSSFSIITRHVLPQTASYVIVALTLSVPGYILAESGLSFLGLGIQQPDASWGNMLKEAQDISNVINQPWMLTPGFLIFLAVLSFNVIGDAVRDVLDPKSSHMSA